VAQGDAGYTTGMERKDLEGLSREELAAKAEGLGVVRPRTLTIAELVDEILLATERKTGLTQKRSRGWFGRARDLLTSVIDRGLAEPTNGRTNHRAERMAPAAPAPLPTVTLAEIYAAQGHFERAIVTLDEVIARDPEHTEAGRLRDRFAEQLRRTRPSAPPPPIELTPVTMAPPPMSNGGSDNGVLHAPSIATLAQEAAHAAGSSTENRGREPGASEVESASSSAIEPDPALAALAPDVLDERYDVDEVVAIAVDPHTVYLYWEVRPLTVAEARAKASSGSLTLRVVSIAPNERGAAPVTEARDIRVDSLSGEIFLRDVPANANVRVAIGWKDAEFVPLAVGLDLATPREAPAQEVARKIARFDGGNIADSYDALRVGGLTRASAGQFGQGPGAGFGPAFGRASREEIALGHGAEESFDPPWIPTSEGPVGGPLRMERRWVRGGASELSRPEVRFFGASEQVRPSRAREDDGAVSLA
jgi:hypothetical protein